MADGAYNSGGGGGDWGGGGSYYGGSDGSGSMSLGAFLLFIVILITVSFIIQAVKSSALEKERMLDRTVYHTQAMNNFNEFTSHRIPDVVESSVMMEQGSSYREDYHCKGTEYQTVDGRDHTVCCSVYQNPTQLCVVIR